MEEFSFGLFNDLLEGDPHPLEIDDYENEEDDLHRTSTKPSLDDKLRSTEGCIYTPVAGDTKLHNAIRCGKQAGINALIELYREDFDKVKDHLVVKYQWDVEDKIWLRKTILVASTEEQCQNAKNLENRQVGAEDLRRAMLVLLKYPVQGEEVAVLHPNEASRSAVAKLITTLIPNGFLSWNYVGLEGTRETFIQSAVSKGMHEVVDRLYELGALIAIPGHNPLVTAIKCKRKETVKWLLTQHFDHFDCTLRGIGGSALIAVMQKNDGELFDFFLEKMIAYRQKYFNETSEEAFQEIFQVEPDEHSYTTILKYVLKSGPILERVEKAIQMYKLKLSHRWNNSIVLGSLIKHEIALDYCFEGIRNDPQLLGLKEHESTTILHKLLRLGHFEFVREMYTKHPEVMSFFNIDGAFNVLAEAIKDQSLEGIRFMLEHHGEFLRFDLDILREQVVCCQFYKNEFCEARHDLLEECFPELRDSIEEMRTRVPTESNYDGVEGSFANANINVTDLDKLSGPYSTVRGSNGETLLHLAVDKDDMELLVRMLEAGCELDLLDNDGNHPVHLVKSEEMLDLIDRHPEGRKLIQRTNNDGCTVLHKLCQQNIDSKKLIALLEKVIAYGADVHQLTKQGENAVFFAGDHDVLDFLRSHAVKLDHVNNSGETALEKHLWNVWVARPLFSYVQDLPSFKEHAHQYLAPMLDQTGHIYTYDYKVIFEKYPEAARIMLDSVYEHSHEEASRLFCKACTTGFVHVVQLFLSGNYDLDLNYMDVNGGTPLLGIVDCMDQPDGFLIFKRLLENGVDVRNDEGRDALSVLIWRYRTCDGFRMEAIELLLDHGVSINSSDERGNTPLHWAFENGDMELVEFLVQRGADSSAVNNGGKRPIEVTTSVNRELFYFYS